MIINRNGIQQVALVELETGLHYGGSVVSIIFGGGGVLMSCRDGKWG
jgi:hypothetical protein